MDKPFDFWRDFDLRPRKEKIEKAFNCEKLNSAEDFPVIVSTRNYFAFGSNPRPLDYWENPAFMLKFQQDYYYEHLKEVQDDLVPYFMPWFGTGVLASGFGCTWKAPIGNGNDPFVEGHIIDKPEEIAGLKLPDPHKDGIMPKVLMFMEYAKTHGDLPVGPTDLNSPLCTAAQLCGYDNLFVWMYEEPEAIHDLLAMVTEAFINWVTLQKEYSGEPMDASNGLQGIWSPKGVGVWVSDDDLVSVGGDLYEEFVVPCYQKLFTAFSGGHLHYCGVGTQHLENFRKIKGIRAINNSILGNFKDFETLAKRRPAGTALEIQDGVTANPEDYFRQAFANITDFSGIMAGAFALDTLMLSDTGTYVPAPEGWDPVKAANLTVKGIRAVVAEKLNAAA